MRGSVVEVFLQLFCTFSSCIKGPFHEKRCRLIFFSCLFFLPLRRERPEKTSAFSAPSSAFDLYKCLILFSFAQVFPPLCPFFFFFFSVSYSSRLRHRSLTPFIPFFFQLLSPVHPHVLPPHLFPLCLQNSVSNRSRFQLYTRCPSSPVL